MKKKYDFKKFEDVLRFVENSDDSHTCTERKVIATMIYLLHNEVRNTFYNYNDIEEYIELSFKIEEIDPMGHYIVTINDNEKYRLFLNKTVKNIFARQLALKYIEERLHDVHESFPDIVQYIDEEEMLKDMLLDTPNLIGLYGGNEYGSTIKDKDVYMYRLN